MTMPPPDGQRAGGGRSKRDRSGFWHSPWLKLAVFVLFVLANPFSRFGLSGPSKAVPTNYLTQVSGIGWAQDAGDDTMPDLDRLIDVRVLGGDASIELTVTKGAKVELAGYQDEDPYLRVREDGLVEVNTYSAAHALNSARYAGTSSGPPVDASHTDWTVVSRDGRYDWHDHRAHWMAESPPLGVTPWDGTGKAPDSAVAVRGTIPLTVNGYDAEIDTVTYLLRAPSAAWSWAVAAVFAAIAVVAGRVLGRRRRLAAALVLAAFISIWAVWVVFLLDEPERWASWHLALPFGAVGLFGWGACQAAPWRLVGSLAGLLLLGTGATLMPTFGAALAPGLGPEWLARVVGAASIGVGAVVVLSGTWELFSALRAGPSRLASTVTE